MVCQGHTKLSYQIAWTYLYTFNPITLGFLKVVFPWEDSIWSPFIFQEEVIKYQYNFILLLNNLVRGGWHQLKKKCWHHLLYAGVINFFVKKWGLEKEKKKVLRNSFEELNDLSNVNKIFRKYMTYDNIKCYKKLGFHSLSRRHIFRKTTGGGQVAPPSLFRVNNCFLHYQVKLSLFSIHYETRITIHLETAFVLWFHRYIYSHNG